jgi:hypothetical protein
MLDNLPAKLRSLREIVDEYDAKAASIPAAIEEFNRAVTAAQSATCIGGTYAGNIFNRGAPSLYERDMRANLLQSAWTHVYHGLNLHMIAPASDRSKFELAFKDPAPFTLDNIRATFGKYVSDPRGSILRGLAECFAKLDPAFKSHDRMKIGVKGLPKRIILPRVTDYGYGGWGTERLRDTLNALRVLRGQPHLEYSELRDMLEAARKGDSDKDGLKLRRFQNGNAHLFFDAETLLEVNRALAEYYGEVLPDCPEEAQQRAKSTAVAKDLQFYRTPAAVADDLVQRAYPRDGARILEPSCGDGAILDAIRRYASDKRYSIRVTGVEVDPGRAAEARAKGYAVHTANFLQVEPSPDFDHVLMNPPFYGKHYQKHVEHAQRFLKPGGTLLAILPITAVTDHGYVDTGPRGYDNWRDLPVGSFSESGTNINTGIATFGPADR